MTRILHDFIARAVSALDDPQPCNCAESASVRMAQADKVRSDHFEGVRKGLAAAAGEVVAP